MEKNVKFEFLCSKIHQMGNKKSIAVPAEDIEEVSRNTSLKEKEIKYLYNRFQQLKFNKDRDYIIKTDLYDIPGLRSNPLKYLIIRSLFGVKGRIFFPEFAIFINKFRRPSESLLSEIKDDIKHRKLKFLFNLYDVDGDGVISSDDLQYIIDLMFQDHMGKFQRLKILQVMLLEADRTQMKQLIYNDFFNAFPDNDFEYLLTMKIPQMS